MGGPGSGRRKGSVGKSKNRLYHVVAINEKTGSKTYMTGKAMPHSKSVTMLNKFSSKKGRRIQLEEYNK